VFFTEIHFNSTLLFVYKSRHFFNENKIDFLFALNREAITTNKQQPTTHKTRQRLTKQHRNKNKRNKKLTKNNMDSYLKKQLNIEFVTTVYMNGDLDEEFCPRYIDNVTAFLSAGFSKKFQEKRHAQMKWGMYAAKAIAIMRGATIINEDMIKKIERDTLVEAYIRPLQKKIKEILYDPNTRRGKAFALNNIAWAF